MTDKSRGSEAGRQARRHLFLQGSITRALAVLAVPIIFGNIAQTGYQLTDAFWVGRLGASAVAAVSVGIWRGTPVLDLDYAEDSDCDTDMNIVMNDGGGFIELQGTAEGHAFRRDELDALLGLAEGGIAQLFAAQREALAAD